jgi:hypothetical protein
MNLDDYKVVLYRNKPDGWVAEIPNSRMLRTHADARRSPDRTRTRV